VATEVTQQVHRLSWHPSVGVWAGNNEIEGSLGWYAESRTNKQLFAGDYIALFVDTIRNIIKKVRCSCHLACYFCVTFFEYARACCSWGKSICYSTCAAVLS
jgi:beta-galactosidase/beta-glucuronidase